MSDVCLLLEGTYPYVAGGVSSWVNDLIHQLQGITFSIVYMGAYPSATKRLHYKIPENVVDFREIYIFDYRIQRELRRPPPREAFQTLEDFLLDMKQADTSKFNRVVELLGAPRTRCLDLYTLVHSFEGWQMVNRLYRQEEGQPSFVDYYWTWRFLHLPFFSLLRCELPKAGVYHAVSTGYAGVMGALATVQHGRPLILTEHGIYTRERKLEISQADWIYSETAQERKVVEEQEFFREWWIRLFTFFSKLTYERAELIISLYEENRRIQIEEGAPPQKTRVIPNAVDTERLMALPRQSDPNRFCVGFVGRVVPIKDVKTFIRACKQVREELKNIEFYILGPTDEDEAYYQECVQLAQAESLTDVLHFLGKVNVRDYFPKLDLLVLTSISEAQPIVILEGHACGVPAVATEVGACRALLEGSTPDDRLLGESGIVTPTCNPAATARAIIDILTHPDRRARMSQAGRRRVNQYYRMEDLIASYEGLYTNCLERIQWRA